MTSDRGLDDLAQRLPVAVYRTDPAGNIHAANQALASLLGYATVEELMAGDRLIANSYVDPSQREEWRQQVEENGAVYEFMTKLRRRDGSLVWVSDTASSVTDTRGAVLFYEGVLIDVSGQVQANNRSMVLTGVLEATSDLVAVFDAAGHVRYANRAARRFAGMEDWDPSRPLHYDDLLGPGNLLGDLITETLARGEEWSGEIEIPAANGTPIPVWAVVTLHHGRDGEAYMSGIGRELTAMKQTQRQLEELVTAKNIFVATVSHELRNPLTGIVGLAEELRDRFEEFSDRERHDLVTLIAHQSAEMSLIVDDLLVAARADVGEVAVVPQKVDVMATIETVVAGEGRPVEVVPAEGATIAWVDPHRLAQVLRNLLSNAVRYGGKRIRIAAERLDDRIVVSVADDGAGIDPEDRERIFEPYQRGGGPTRSGSVGLGLSVARRLCRLMGGDIEYEEDGAWVIFAISVPAVDDSSLRTA